MVVAIGKDLANEDPYSTLNQAVLAKNAKYSTLGPSFRPLVISAGGLLARQTSKEYKQLQRLIGPSSTYMDSRISLILLRTRANARQSLAN